MKVGATEASRNSKPTKGRSEDKEASRRTKATSGGHKDVRSKRLLEVLGDMRVCGCCRLSPTASCVQDRHTDSAGVGLEEEAARPQGVRAVWV